MTKREIREHAERIVRLQAEARQAYHGENWYAIMEALQNEKEILRKKLGMETGNSVAIAMRSL